MNKREIQKKVIISVSLSKDIVDVLNTNCSNRSAYLDRALLSYFEKNGIDISDVKL